MHHDVIYLSEFTITEVTCKTLATTYSWPLWFRHL